jgi:hypothetical protein
MADVEDAVDRLYQLPLEEFTSARNALAKELKRPALKELEKPNVAAWAVNQLYWKERATHDRLAKASERLRGEHRKLLAGKSSDIREAEKAHREIVRDALEKARGLLQSAGQALSPATLAAVQETLEALPAQDAAGRLTRPLKPAGFEALSGMAIAPTLRIVHKPPAREAEGTSRTGAKEAGSKENRARERQLAKQREREEEERKERQREAERELKLAEAAMLKAEEAVKKAEKTLGELRAARDAAVSEYQRARLRAHE